MLNTRTFNSEEQLSAAHEAVDRARDGLRAASGRIRQDGAVDPELAASIRGCLDALCEELHALQPEGLDPQAHAELAELLMAELDPYLYHSPSAKVLMGRIHEPVASVSVVKILQQPPPEGGMGAVLEAWVRALPSMAAWREIPRACIRAAATAAEAIPGGAILVLGGDHPGVTPSLALLGDDREIVSLSWTPGMALSELSIAPSIVVIAGLIEALPSRHLIGLLEETKKAMKTGGRVVASSLVPSSDAALMALALGWPTIRRTPAQLLDLFLLAGFSIVGDASSPSPGLVVIAEDKARAISMSSEQ